MDSAVPHFHSRIETFLSGDESFLFGNGIIDQQKGIMLSTEKSDALI
jgi:hypothetical protein